MWFVLGLMIIHSATGATYNPASITLIPQIVNENLIQKPTRFSSLLQKSSGWEPLHCAECC